MSVFVNNAIWAKDQYLSTCTRRNLVVDEAMLQYIVEKIDADKNYGEEQRIAAEFYFEKVQWAANKRRLELPDYYYGVDGSKEIVKAIEARNHNLNYERSLLRGDFERWKREKEKEYIAMYSTEEFRKVEEMRDKYFLEKLKLEEQVKELQKLQKDTSEKLMKANTKLQNIENGVFQTQDYINLEKRNEELEMMLKMKDSTIMRLKEESLIIT